MEDAEILLLRIHLQKSFPVKRSFEYVSSFCGLWGTVSTVSVMGCCYCLKTSSWAKPHLLLDIISVKPTVWALSPSYYLLLETNFSNVLAKFLYVIVGQSDTWIWAERHKATLQSTSSVNEASRHDVFRQGLSSLSPTVPWAPVMLQNQIPTDAWDTFMYNC